MRALLIITLLLTPVNVEAYNQMYYKGQRYGYKQGMRACPDYNIAKEKLVREKRELLRQIEKLRKDMKNGRHN